MSISQDDGKAKACNLQGQWISGKLSTFGPVHVIGSRFLFTEAVPSLLASSLDWPGLGACASPCPLTSWAWSLASSSVLSSAWNLSSVCMAWSLATALPPFMSMPSAHMVNVIRKHLYIICLWPALSLPLSLRTETQTHCQYSRLVPLCAYRARLNMFNSNFSRGAIHSVQKDSKRWHTMGYSFRSMASTETKTSRHGDQEHCTSEKINTRRNASWIHTSTFWCSALHRNRHCSSECQCLGHLPWVSQQISMLHTIQSVEQFWVLSECFSEF